MMAALILGLFFSSIFEVNAVCLRYINASKENVAALESVQDRLEGLRSFAFADLISTTYMKGTNALKAPANASTHATVVSEEVTLTDYENAANTITYSRSSGASVTPNSIPASYTFPTSTKLVRVRVKHTWTGALGGRIRTEESETVISGGIKK